MPGRGMVSVDDVLAWGPQTEGVDQEVMSRCIDFASELIERETGRRFLTGSYTYYHSGSGMDGMSRNTLWLSDAEGLALTHITTAGTLTENGTDISVALVPTGPLFGDGDGGYIEEETGAVHRVIVNGTNVAFVPWAAGWANISITVDAGWTLEDMPSDIKQAAIEAAKMIYREGFRVGVGRSGSAGSSVDFRKELSPGSAAALTKWTIYGRPRTTAP